MSSNQQTFRPERTHLLAAGVLFLIMLLVIGAKPAYLFWLPIFPALFGYWVLRSATTVDGHGISVKYAFSANRTIQWEDFAGISFKGARAFACTTEGEEISLPGITFNSLPALSEASHGRIPDPVTAGKKAADEKVVVIQRDGRQILKPREEATEEEIDQPTQD